MANELTIWNQALSLIGMKIVGSTEEKSTEALKCKLFYDTAREDVLRKHNWKFAKKNVILSESTGDKGTVPLWHEVYMYPSDCLIARRVYNDSIPDGTIIKFDTMQSNVGEYEILTTDLSPAYLEYTANVANSGLFFPGFSTALAHRLAYYMAPSLTGDKQITQGLYNSYLIELEQAKKEDASEGYNKDESSSSYVKVRG